jgi:hypothetical protein
MLTAYLVVAGCEIDLHLWQSQGHQSFGAKILLGLQEAEWLRSQATCFDLLSWEDGISGLALLSGLYVARCFSGT